MEEDAVGAYVTEAPPIAPEPVVPETGDNLDTGADAYDFKEYDLKEYDLGEVDNRVYEYGAYDEYGRARPDPTDTDDEEVGPGVAAETDVSGSTVSTTTPPGLATDGCEHERHAFNVSVCVVDSLCLPAHAFLVGCLAMCHWRVEASRLAAVSLVCGRGFDD